MKVYVATRNNYRSEYSPGLEIFGVYAQRENAIAAFNEYLDDFEPEDIGWHEDSDGGCYCGDIGLAPLYWVECYELEDTPAATPTESGAQ
jgi:hypothetical protein